MKPVHTLSYIIIVLAVLALVSFSFPKQGVKIGKLELNFVNIPDLIQPETIQYADIKGIINTDEAKNALSDLESNQTDKSEALEQDTLRYKADSLRRVTFPLQFPSGDRTLLYPFFHSLDKKAKNVHILHYGDSQLEGDRISSYIRHKLQRRFGGFGPGLLAANPVIKQTMSVNQDYSSNWIHYALFGNHDSTLLHTPFGPMLAYGRFKPQLNIEVEDTALVKSWLSISKSYMSFRETRKYNRFRLYYGDAGSGVQVKLFANDSLASETILNQGNSNVWKINFDTLVSNVKLEFEGKRSPNIYGICLDSYTGVFVDNIPLRGSSGLEFTKNDLDQMSGIVADLNAKLIIMQFGVNVVPNQRKSYKFYENWFFHQLIAVKQASGDVPVIVIGLSDMAHKDGDNYVSYPNVEKIRDAQKNAAFRANCAFWDMYEAMGGKNSMPAWVFAKPPLANKDFTHFNYKGSVILSSMFYNALMREYRAYIHRDEKTYQPIYLRQKTKHI